MRSQHREFRKALLIELIWILAGAYLLALGAVVPRMMDKSGPVSRISPTRAQLANLKTAIELYRVDQHGTPPRKLQYLLTQPLYGAEADGWKGPYLQDVTSIPADPWGDPYVYEVPGPEGETCRLTSYGEDGKPDGTGDAEDVSVSVP